MSNETGLNALKAELDNVRSMDNKFEDKMSYYNMLTDLYYGDQSPMELDRTEEGRKTNEKICAQISADMIAKFGG